MSALEIYRLAFQKLFLIMPEENSTLFSLFSNFIHINQMQMHNHVELMQNLSFTFSFEFEQQAQLT